MKTPRSHPPLEQWMRWLDGDPVDGDLERHLEDCGACRALVDTLESAQRAKGRGVWREPPAELVDRAVRVRTEKRLPPSHRTRPVSWSATDVRGDAAAVTDDDARIVAASADAGELSLLVRPPRRDARWSFELRVWLGPEDEAAPAAEVGLVHGDHVVARHEVRDGEVLRFREIVPAGWSLEIHMPDGEALVVHDPFGRETG